MDNIDNALRIAWQTRDWELRDRVWTHLWNVAYTKAVKYCRQRLRCDQSTAEDNASKAFLNAVIEIEAHVHANSELFQGIESFEPWVTARVMYRCWDAIRKERRWNALKAFDHTLDHEGDTMVETLEADGPSPEDEVIAATSIRELARTLEVAREKALLARSFALVKVIDEILRYLRERFVAAVPVLQGQTHGQALGVLSLDELADMADLDQFDFDQTDMNMVVMQQLQLSRNEFDLRMKRIRKILRAIRAAA